METINIKHCEGYLWQSDQESPEVFSGESLDRTFDESENPFFVEGQLYDVDNRKSYSIKYVDGQYIVKDFLVEQDILEALGSKEECALSESCTVERKCYLSNRLGEKELWLVFFRYWMAEEDPGCLNLPVLKLKKNVFVGFKK